MFQMFQQYNTLLFLVSHGKCISRYAKASGFNVILPDFFDGDAMPKESLQYIEPPLKVRDQLTMVDKA